MKMTFKQMVLSCLKNTLYSKMMATGFMIATYLLYTYFCNEAGKVIYPICMVGWVLIWLFGKDDGWFVEEED